MTLTMTILALWLSGADADSLTQAKDAFKQGQASYKAQKFDDAIVQFKKANALSPNPAFIFNIARCYEQLADTPKALETYRSYLVLSPRATDKQEVVNAVIGLEKKLRDRGVQQVAITIEPSAILSVDGRALGPSPVTTELKAGTHQVTADLAGYEAVSQSITVTLQKTNEVKLVMNKRSVAETPDIPFASKSASVAPVSKTPERNVTSLSRAPEDGKLSRPGTILAGGAAVAGLGTGIILGVVASNEAARIKEAPLGQAPVIANNAQSLAIGANVAYGIAGAAAITAVILFFVEGRD